MDLKMKLSIKCLSLAAAIASFGLVSCSDNDEPVPEPVVEEVTSGIYVINNGVQTGNIPGGITVYNLEDGAVTAEAFSAANGGLDIGDTPQSAIIYGSKMYVAVFDSNIIWVLDASDLKVIKSIRPSAPMNGPRCFAADAGKVYVSMYSGQVARIDTAAMDIEASIAVGPNPEEIAIAGRTLYCANSDGLNWENGNADSSVSLVDLDSWIESKMQVGQNPVKMVSNGNDVFVLAMGNYYDVPAMVRKIQGNTVTDVCPGTLMDINGSELYVIDAPGGTPTYSVYDMNGRKLREMVSEGVESPSGFAVDPVSGDILIMSYHLGSTGYALYSDPCYARLYSAAGQPRATFDTGVGAICGVFRHSYTVVK